MTNMIKVDKLQAIKSERPEEIWLSVKGYEGKYEVSDQGRILSLPRTVARLHPKTGLMTDFNWSGKLMAQNDTGDGYFATNLSKDGTSQLRYVSHLVAEAFIGHRPENQEVCHNDGDRSNNKLDNLRYDTHQDNCLDKSKHGTDLKGEQHYRTKITEDQVREVKTLLQNYGSSEISRRTGIGCKIIEHIKYGDSWKHIDA